MPESLTACTSRAPSTFMVFDVTTGQWVPLGSYLGQPDMPPAEPKPKPRRRPRKPIVVPPPPVQRPSPEEIAEACAEIRKGWSKREHRVRAGAFMARWSVPEIRTGKAVKR